MEITIRNYKKILPEDIIKKSRRCIVRECDEVGPGVFESYVDELDRSYDVSLTLQKNNLISHSCECESSDAICHHRVALLNSIAKGPMASSKISSARKIDPLKKALEEADPAKLQDWLHKLFKKQKEVALAFMNEFSTGSKLSSPAEVISLTQDAVKAVINKRGKAETVEVKKIVELWTVIHRPIFENFFASPTNADCFASLNAVIDTVYNFRYQIRTSSKRFESYLQQVMNELSTVISNIHDDDSWSISIRYFLSELFSSYYGELRSVYINLLINNFNSGSSNRRAVIVQELINICKSINAMSDNASRELLQFTLRVVVANKQFAAYKDLFMPIRYANEYNLRLIDSLMEIGDFKKAESYCIDQINHNTNPDYNFGYDVRLKRIYQETNNDTKLLSVIARELLKRPDFEQYKRVVSAFPNDAEFKKWRNLVLANARGLARFDKNAVNFSLALRHFESDWKGMLAYIDENADYDSILMYADSLFDNLPELFIKKMIEKQDSARDQILEEEDRTMLDEVLEELYQLSISRIGVESFRLMVNERKIRFRTWVNIFVAYASRKLDL